MSPTGLTPAGAHVKVGLAHQVQMVERGLWPAPPLVPTPTAGDSRNSRNATANRTHLPPSGRVSATYTLSDYVTLFPTPKASDAIGGGRCYEKPPSRQGGPALKEQIGRLNPAWVEILMGYPPGWTELLDSGTATGSEACPASPTASATE